MEDRWHYIANTPRSEAILDELGDNLARHILDECGVMASSEHQQELLEHDIAKAIKEYFK